MLQQLLVLIRSRLTVGRDVTQQHEYCGLFHVSRRLNEVANSVLMLALREAVVFRFQTIILRDTLSVGFRAQLKQIQSLELEVDQLTALGGFRNMQTFDALKHLVISTTMPAMCRMTESQLMDSLMEWRSEKCMSVKKLGICLDHFTHNTSEPYRVDLCLTFQMVEDRNDVRTTRALLSHHLRELILTISAELYRCCRERHLTKHNVFGLGPCTC